MRYEQRSPTCWYDSVTGGFVSSPPDGDVDPAPLLSWHKSMARALLNAACNSAITGGITVAGLSYDTDQQEQNNMQAVVSNGVTSIGWWCRDAEGVYSKRTHTKDQLLAVKAAFMVRTERHLDACRSAKGLVEAAATVPAVTAALEAGLGAIAAV